jgi:hypothetical protein
LLLPAAVIPSAAAPPASALLIPVSLAVALAAAAIPAQALVITSEVGVNTAVEFDSFGHILHEAHADTTSGGPANARVKLGNGVNAFDDPTFAQAFSAFSGLQAKYWINLNADNTINPGDGGRGAAGVDLTYTANKEHGDTSFTLHVTGGKLQLIDPDAGSDPLDAFVDLEAFVTSGSSIISHTTERAELSGNGGTRLLETFKLTSTGFDIRPGDFTLQDDGTFAKPGPNIVGATLDLRPLNIPVDLSRLVDGTPISIEVTLNGEARAPGGETVALAFLRDPAHIDDADPLAGAPTITFETGSTGPVAGVPEPPAAAVLGLALLASALFARRFRRRGQG